MWAGHDSIWCCSKIIKSPQLLAQQKSKDKAGDVDRATGTHSSQWWYTHELVRHVLEGFTVPAQLQINNLDLSTTDGAREAIGTIGFAFGLLDTQQAEIAASTNRLLTEQTSLMSEAVDLKSVATVIDDADLAEEMVKNTNEKMAIMSSTSVIKSWF